MQLEVNGEWRQIEEVKGKEGSEEATTVAKVVEILALPAALVLIEHNGEALHRSEWGVREVREGDRLEILRVAAGG